MKFQSIWVSIALSVTLLSSRDLSAQTLVNGSRVVQGAINYCADAGAANAYACSLSPAISAYITGACYSFKAAAANTGASTVNLNSLGTKPIRKAAGGITTDLAANDIRAGQIVSVCYDGTVMQMQSILGNAAATGTGTGSTNPIISASGEPGYFPLGVLGSMASGYITGVPNVGTCHAFVNEAKVTVSTVSFQVTAASGTACTGGVCGFQVGLYDKTKTLVAYTEAGTSNHSTAGKNINDTTTANGVKTLSFAGGSSVSAGKLTLDPGGYWMCYTTDSTGLALLVWNNNSWMEVAHRANGAGDKHGYRSGLSTGNGGAISLVNSWTGTLTNSGSGSEVAVMYLLP